MPLNQLQYNVIDLYNFYFRYTVPELPWWFFFNQYSLLKSLDNNETTQTKTEKNMVGCIAWVSLFYSMFKTTTFAHTVELITIAQATKDVKCNM